MKRIIVVGAGVAGLSAALRLRKLGADVLVLEKESQPGGRVQSIRENGFVVDRGASSLMSSYRQTFELIRTLGLENELERPRVPSRYEVLFNGRFFRADYGSRLGLLRYRAAPLAQRLRAGRLAMLALKLRGPHSPEFLTTRGLEILDDEDLGHFISHAIGNDVMENFFEPMLTAYCGWTPEGVSRSYLALLTRIGKMDLFVFGKGAGQLTEALARAVPVKCRAKAVSIVEAAGGIDVAVESADDTCHILNADGVVLALPGPTVSDLWRGCNEPERSFLRHVSYAPTVSAYLCADRDWGYHGYHGFFFPRKSGRKTTGVALDHARYGGRAPAGKSLLHTQPRLNENPNLFSAPDAEVIDVCTRDIEPEFPGIRDAVRNTYVFRWNNALPRVPVGFFRGLCEFLNTRASKRIELAGDYIGGPCIEGAVVSGNSAAQRVFLATHGRHND
jgi:oxygen-dependent protoporphyrinogen oxidase